MKTKLFMAASAVAIMFATGAAAQDSASFSLFNNGDKELVTLQISGSSDPSWGEDVLSGTAAPGATINVNIPSLEECEYDVKATYIDDDTEMLWNIDLCDADALEFDDDDADEPDPEGDEEDEEDGDDEDDADDEDDSDDEDEDDADDEEEDDSDDEEEEDDADDEEEDEEEEADDEEEEEESDEEEEE